MEDEPNYHLMARVLGGTATPGEEAEIAAWVGADPERRRSWELLRSAWEISGSKPQMHDPDAGWRRVVERIRRRDGQEGGGRALRPRPAWTVAARIAALIALVVIPWAAWIAGRSRLVPEPLVQAMAAPGRVERVTLPDGSLVHLAPGSTLSYSTHPRSPREVRLDGMADFDVARDPDRPFSIRTPLGATVRVLGTHFVMRAFDGVSAVEVAVSEGRVALGLPGSEHDEAVLVAGQVGRLDPGGRVTVAQASSLDPYRAWISGSVVIENRPLAESLAELGRWYGVEMRVDDPELATRAISTTAIGGRMVDVVDRITRALGARYELHGDTMVVVP